MIRRWVEFLLLFILAPLLLALLFPPGWMFPLLWLWTLVGLVLLFVTDTFRWRSLRARIGWRDLVLAVAFFAACLIIAVLLTGQLMPERLFVLPREEPLLWLMIMALYPILSALPQELVFRTLYFERYGSILPKRGALTINAAIFAYAHLLYESAIVLGFTFVGGYFFAKAYRDGNFPLAVILHSLAGCAIFTSGLGWLFYSGSVN